MITLHNANCLDLIDTFPKDAAILTDPPYGCRNNCNYTRFSGGLSQSRNHNYRTGKVWQGIPGDDKPFDPTPFLKWKKVILLGYQFFAQHLPLGTILVWNKKRDSGLGKFLSDVEIAWMRGGKGAYIFQHCWNGFDRESERGKTLHPTQKPVALMKWCLTKLKLPPHSTIIDPYFGSGSVGIAAVEMGHHFIGREIDPHYFSIGKERIEQAEANYHTV